MSISIWKSALALSIVVLLFSYLYSNGLLEHLIQLDWYWWLLSVMSGWLVMTLSSWTMFLAKTGDTPPFKTLVLFPIAQNIAGYMFPLQGSLIFSSIYFKHSYGVDFGRSIGFNFVILLISIGSVGLIGLVQLSLFTPEPDHFYIAISLFFVMFMGTLSVLVLCCRCNFKAYNDSGELLHSSLWGAALRQISDIQQQVRRFSESPRIQSVYLGKIAAYFFWFCFLAYVLESELSLIELLFLVFAVDVSLVFKLVPGNWGISQASGGIALALIDAPVVDGVLVITVSMVSVAILITALGAFSANYLTKDLSGDSLKSLYRIIRVHAMARNDK